jgi:hypothetical protein
MTEKSSITKRAIDSKLLAQVIEKISSTGDYLQEYMSLI